MLNISIKSEEYWTAVSEEWGLKTVHESTFLHIGLTVGKMQDLCFNSQNTRFKQKNKLIGQKHRIQGNLK